MRTRAAILVGGLMLAGAGPARAETRRIDVDEAVALALQSDAGVRAARSHTRAAAANAKSARGRMLPSITLSNEYQHWDSPFAIPFGTQPFHVHDQDTNSFVASASQPLVGLLHHAEEYRAQSSSADAMAAGQRTTEQAIRESVQVQYLLYFAAHAAEEIARTAEEQLGEQVRMAESNLKAGVITNADVLRLRVAVASARQQQIQAQAQQEIARADIVAAIGLDPGEAVDLAEPVRLLSDDAAPLPPLADSVTLAIARRPELAQANHLAGAAAHTRRARGYSLLPDVDLEGAYLRTDGSILNPANAEFVGVKARWTIWEWGASYYAFRAAAEEAEAAAAAAEDTRRMVRLDVQTHLSQARAARSAVEVAGAAISSATEAYRVTGALVKAGEATTTDLLAAHQALVETQLNLTRARYQEAIIRVGMARATGQ